MYYRGHLILGAHVLNESRGIIFSAFVHSTKLSNDEKRQAKRRKNANNAKRKDEITKKRHAKRRNN